jgi:NADH-quinone oxidoreductase subunit C/D
MNITEKISRLVPGITVAETGDQVVTVPVESFRQVAEALRNDKDEPMDFLRDIVGMDWQEGGLGALYYLESSKTYNRIVLKTSTTDRENPFLPSVCDLWKTAEIKEREVFDFFGIRFLNNPDMRRLFLREDWIGYPLRKDYDMNSNPLNMENEENADITEEYYLNRTEQSLTRKTLFSDSRTLWLTSVPSTLQLTEYFVCAPPLKVKPSAR